MVEVKVENFRARRQMEHDLSKLLNDDWTVASQSGRMSNTPWGRMFPLLSPKVTVILTRNRA